MPRHPRVHTGLHAARPAAIITAPPEPFVPSGLIGPEDAQHIAANRALAVALAPLSARGTYVNFLSDAGVDRVHAAYGGVLYDRLARLKREYDPANLFSRNHNVGPAQ